MSAGVPGIRILQGTPQSGCLNSWSLCSNGRRQTIDELTRQHAMHWVNVMWKRSDGRGHRENWTGNIAPCYSMVGAGILLSPPLHPLCSRHWPPATPWAKRRLCSGLFSPTCALLTQMVTQQSVHCCSLCLKSFPQDWKKDFDALCPEAGVHSWSKEQQSSQCAWWVTVRPLTFPLCEMGAIGGFGAEDRSNPTSVLIDNSVLDTGREG